MAFLFKRKNSKYWQIGWYDPHTGKSGKPVSSKTVNRRDAERKLKEFEKDLQQRHLEDNFKLPGDRNLLLSDVFKLYVQDRANIGKQYSPLTLESYKIALDKYFYPSCGDKKLYLYGRDDYHQFVSAMAGISQNSRAIYTKRLYALFKWLAVEGYIHGNPMKRVEEEEKEFRILSCDEFYTLLDYASKSKYYYLVKFLALSAFRIQEALNIKSSDIEEKIIRVKGKGSKYASIPITAEMREFLENELPVPEDKDALIFPHSYDMVHRFWVRLRKATGLECTVHDIRKYCLSEMANSGVPINFVKNYARHSDIKTTLKYYIRVDASKMTDEIDAKVKIFKKEVKPEVTMQI